MESYSPSKIGRLPSLLAGDWPSEDELTALGPGRRELLVTEGFNWSLSGPVGRVDCPGTRLEGVPAGGERMLTGGVGLLAGGECVEGEGVSAEGRVFWWELRVSLLAGDWPSDPCQVPGDQVGGQVNSSGGECNMLDQIFH